ncbi:MAG: HD domain-containing phosphohydrolase [Planctomycetaceae bacterium]
MSAPALTCPESNAAATVAFRLSETIAGLSSALDLAEGQPEGHAARTCLVGTQIGEALGLSPVERAELFYALLLKDLGGSSNAAKMAFLFSADDREIKRDLLATDWARTNVDLPRVSPEGRGDESPWGAVLHSMIVALEGPGAANKLVQLRARRGAELARQIGFSDGVTTATPHLDEHWDGRGRPGGLRGAEIALAARIACLAQATVAAFSQAGPEFAAELVRDRRGRWFDPELSDILLSLARRDDFWTAVAAPDPWALVAHHEPEVCPLSQDETTLDRITAAFAEATDAKSPWTYRHSTGVARIAAGIAGELGMSPAEVAAIRRAALLHDLGKLGVSNLVLDKPGRLTEPEVAEIRRHAEWTTRILERTPGLSDLAPIAGSHHERLDGRGYPRGLTAGQLTREMRLLAVADVAEALGASRPYRQALSRDEVQAKLRSDAGTLLCAECVAALISWQDRTDISDRINLQLTELERVISEL